MILTKSTSIFSYFGKKNTKIRFLFFHSVIPKRYDAFIFIDQTLALHPIPIDPEETKFQILILLGCDFNDKISCKSLESLNSRGFLNNNLVLQAYQS